ncbi:DNA polymerase III subunit beta [Candidatus Woesebacteria bacterium RBG_19FT_COMBO_42_9]|uniref:Beta sliding clamp n=1 Tax=Candidatus Woesebacteria bacterium RBG_16_42_24 TaxID=1802485 RepID=A0A1F7XLB3_9BACT|nr:MAG: DNA polymerase III subunit beta [Candidatus Woesebacteria bacterium RBG_16_42_24]OGM17885.1 MAG: DNA polymerase III subunit beta [Candidatus Woesebacteria bacterium RBG_19FT_COMBO_42_9]OGM68246.1 MAG: DNA polymerase III subunit beta [Candidatus Woesebacteria bacterium RIFCSPLOWO2_01_FULL_43_11]
MKLEVLQENFSRALSTASRFASSRAQLPVLGNIYLSAKKNKLLVCSTNLEVSVAISIGAKVSSEGEITIPSRVISELVVNFTPGAIMLNSEKEILEISSSNTNSSVSGMNAVDFPEVPQSLGKTSYSFPKEALLQALSQVVFAASTDETRPILTGVLFLFKKGGLSLVATDGFRLSQKKLQDAGFHQEKKVILPKSALSELARIGIEEQDLKLSFREEDNQVVFGVGDTILSTRILEGDFPEFEKIIPKETNIKVSLDKDDLLRAVKLASVFARDSANIVRFSLKKDGVVIAAESQMAGRQESQVEAKVEGLPTGGFEISFNYRFLEEFLHAVSGGDVNIGLSNENAPGVFTDPSDVNFLHLIMPVRVQV